MDILRLIFLIYSTIVLGRIAYTSSISRSHDGGEIHEKLRELEGPVYTFVKTDKNGNIKWGVRHYLPRKN